jgi:predicted enzyme related to lactoylglutathione lyase
MKTAKVSAVLFVKDLRRVAAFYSGALDMTCTASDEHHSALDCRGFTLIVQQIPKHIAAEIKIEQPPERRVWGAVRLDFPVRDLARSRQLAQSLGGGIDVDMPEWADANTNLYLGYDPEGNQIGVSQQDH